MRSKPLRISLLAMALSGVVGCSELEPHPVPVGPQASFDVRPGVEIVTVTNADPAVPLTLYDADGNKLLTLISDAFGQAHFAYIPYDYMVLDTAEGTIPIVEGTTLKRGDGYVIRNDTTDPPDETAPFSVLGVDDVPSVSLYDGQELVGVNFGLFGDGGLCSSPAPGKTSRLARSSQA